MSPVFLEISGSVQSTNEENSQEKTATFSRRTAQVSVLHIVFFFIWMSSISFIYLCDVFISDLFESTLWKKGKDNKQFLKRIFLLSRKDFTLRYFIKEDVSTSVAIYFSVQRRFLCFHRSSTNTFLFPSSIHCSKNKSKVPKAVICMKDLNAVFQPEKINHTNGLQISYLHGERMRNLFVYHENGQVSSVSR